MKKTYIFFISLIDFIENLYSEQLLSKIQKKKIFLLFLKSQQFVKFFFLSHFVFIKLISVLIFFRTFNLLSKKNKIKIFNFLYKKNILKFKKIIELFYALKQLVVFSREKIKANKINKFKIKDDSYYENIVIGSGPSGSVTSYYLSQNNCETLLIEKGYKTENSKTKHPADEFYHKWKYSGLSGAIGKYDLQFASAECLGGGSEINSGLYHDIDLNFIKKLEKKNKLINFNFQKNEWSDLISSEKKEDSNNAQVNLNNFYIKGSSELNWKIEFLKKFYTRKKFIAKSSMSNTLLNKAESNGLNILTGYEATKFSKSNGTWNLLLKNKYKKLKKTRCKNLFLCCGTPYTLDLLKKNKILKSSHNQNFHFHPMVKVIAKFPKEVNETINENVISTQVTEFYPHYLFGNAASDIQFLKIFTFGNKKANFDVEKNSKYMSIFHSTFSLGSCKFKKIPAINDRLIFFKLNESEKNIVNEGLKNLIKFIFNCGAHYIYLSDENKTKITKFDEEIISKTIDSLKFSFSSVHLLGGIDFGETKDCIFDSFGRCKLKKYDNLFVNDSSLITENLLKNPQATIMSIAKNNILNFIKINK